MKDASTTYVPYPNEPRKPGFTKGTTHKTENINWPDVSEVHLKLHPCVRFTITDRFTPFVRDVIRNVEIFEWKHFPSEQNSLIGLA